MRPFAIPSILESLRADVDCGKITVRDAAQELHEAGWLPFVDEERARDLLKGKE